MHRARMIVPAPDATIGATYFQCAEAFGTNAFLAVPANPTRSYHPAGHELSNAAAAQAVRSLMQRCASAGYGPWARVALLLDNRLEHLLHKLAMNALGICCVRFSWSSQNRPLTSRGRQSRPPPASCHRSSCRR
jgi:acyl-CoA synthetase (AMP-forming)/AMP-acid ligase II